MTLTHVDFNAGIGGASLAAEMAGFTTRAFCEINPFCQQVLRKHWPEVPLFNDIRTVTADDVRGAGIGRIDVAHFSPPCQGLSVAGKQQGEADPRYLWPDTIRVIAELRPAWVVIENVDNAVNLVLDAWLADLERVGYETMALVLPAAAVGAPHLRNRLFVVAHANGDGWGASGQSEAETGPAELSDGTDSRSIGDVARAKRDESERWGEPGELGDSPPTDESEAWERERLRDTPGHSRSAMADSDSAERRPLTEGGNERNGHDAGRQKTPSGLAPFDQDGGSRLVGHADAIGRHGRAGKLRQGWRGELKDAGGEVAQPGVDRVADGLSAGLVGYRSHGLTWPGWPARPYQHDYEPPRTGGNSRKRRLRLKALGNAIVPLQLYPLMAAIALAIEQDAAP